MRFELAVGLMSGTSADGVTAVLVRFGRTVEVLRLKTSPYPPALRSRVLVAHTLTAPELSKLNMELGEAFAQAAIAVMRGYSRVSVIGSHGQTVWHGPDQDPPNTLQLAEPSVIAERTGVPVVADFRPRDMAAGGQGAPLVPAFDEFLFARGPLKALQNIGGIANVSVAGNGKLWAGFDTGPGNCLMDLAVRIGTKGRSGMDAGGRRAARGRPDERKIQTLLKDAFLGKKPPKSIERSYYGEAFLKKHFKKITEKNLPRVLATLNMFTARSIHDAYRRFILPSHRPAEIVLSGGGAKNPVLVENLRRLFAPIPTTFSDKYGILVMAKEAACFAWMGLQALRGRPNHCPQATGARGRRILGKIVPSGRD